MFPKLDVEGSNPFARCHVADMMKVALIIGCVLAMCLTAHAAVIPVSLNNTGTTDWWLASGTVGPLGSGNPNPTLTLNIGDRYQVTVVNTPFHVFELLAKGPTDLQDTVLLSQDDPGALFKKDTDVNFTGFGTGVSQFTLTPALAAAMTDAAKNEIPGYRCGIHTMDMRGNVTLTPEPVTLALMALGGLAMLRRRR